MTRTPEPQLMDDPIEADAYDRADFAAVNARFVDRLLELVGDRPVTRAIDLGCGPGHLTCDLAARRPDWQIVAVDAAAVMIELCARRCADAFVRNVRPTLAGVGELSELPSIGSFDAVVSNSLLHHLPDPMVLWRSIDRLIGPGGVFFLRDLRRPASALEATLIVQKHAGAESQLLQEEFLRSLHAAFTADEIRHQLTRAGLSGWQVVEVDDRYVDVFFAPG